MSEKILDLKTRKNIAYYVLEKIKTADIFFKEQNLLIEQSYEVTCFFAYAYQRLYFADLIVAAEEIRCLFDDN